MARLVVVGSTNVDLTLRLPRLPRPGETLSATELRTGHGGKGANQAVLAARLGAHVTMISAVGDDAFGKEALENYRRQQIDTTHVRVRADQPTGTAVVLVEEGGDNEILIAAGANATVGATDVRAAAAAITTAHAVLTQLETPLEAAEEAFRLARSAGVRTLLNPAPARPLPDDLLRRTDLCVPNETELAALTSLPADSLAEIETAARRLLTRGPTVVLVTLGARGVLLISGPETTHIPAVPVRAVDATAAGDAFLGSLAVFLSDGLDLTEAVRRACAVAALTVTRPGAQESFPSPQELADFLNSGSVHK
jgi:ribokinase